jgi:hypothetical protein
MILGSTILDVQKISNPGKRDALVLIKVENHYYIFFYFVKLVYPITFL